MSKYNLEEIHNNNLKEALSAEEKDRFDQLSDSDQLKLEKIFSMMQAEKDAKKSTNEDFDSVVDKIKDSGKSEEDAKKIAGAINAKYVGNYREGVEENGHVDDYTEEIAEENDEDKLPMDEARVDRDVAERIEGMLSIPLKRKFLDSFMDVWQDLIEEDPFYAEDVINHLNNEMHKEIDGYQAVGDKLAGIGENGDVDDYAEEISEEMDDSVKDLLDKISNHLKGSDRNFQDGEIKMYIDSLKRDIKRGEIDDVKSASMEDHEEDLENYIADRALQEHFGRFLKDYQ
jgi:uncharacterized protein (DUF2267 family)